MSQIHGLGGSGADFVLCGIAEDAFESGDHEEQVVIAAPGEIVTCTACRQIIDHVRNTFKNYHTKGKS